MINDLNYKENKFKMIFKKLFPEKKG